MKISEWQSETAILRELGLRLASARINRSQTQSALAAKAGISVRTLDRLENGHGAQLANVVRVLRALGQLDELNAIAPILDNPLLTKGTKPRKRVRVPRKRTSTAKPAWSWDAK
jgi:transcriptional regulator with XRE-family HTH domain